MEMEKLLMVTKEFIVKHWPLKVLCLAAIFFILWRVGGETILSALRYAALGTFLAALTAEHIELFLLIIKQGDDNQ